MNITLGKIIEAANKNQTIEGLDKEIIDAIGAAYWAGESEGIKQERAKTEARFDNLELGRYHQVEGRIARVFCPNHEARAVGGLSEEVNEFKTWDFNL